MSSNSLMNLAFEDNLVRVHLDSDGNPWFVVKDVCRVLELSNPSEATNSLDEDEKGSIRITDGTSPAGGNPNMLTISESGLYALVFRSRKPEAKRLRKWVTAEVLPAIRKTGGYALPGSPAALPKGPYAELGLPELPEDIRRISGKERARCLHLAQQTARIAGITDVSAVNHMFVDYCRKLSGGVLPFAGRGETDKAAIREFVRQCCKPGRPNTRMALGPIYNAYRDWCLDQGDGLDPAPRSVFITILPIVADYCRLVRPRVKGERMWCVDGLTLNENSVYAHH
jgi:hypothetical protein